MKFSIITAAKNNKHGLKNAIECVRNQSYKHVEHIIIDGGSTDGSIDSLINYKLKINNLEFVSEPDNGIYDAINKGIKMASGDVIGLLHSDDLYADEMVLERVAEAFAQSAESSASYVEAVYSDLVYVRKKFKDVSDKSEYASHKKQSVSAGIKEQAASCSLLSTTYSILRYWKTQKEDFTAESQRRRAIRNGWMPPHPTLFLRKEVFEKYGLYRTDMKIASDYEMILRLFFKYKITAYYLPYTTYLMTLGGESNKSAGNILTKSKEDLKGLKLHEMRFPLLTLFYKNIRKIPQFFLI
ncbi:MAG: glycosyltransferase [Ignavibacterium sp.]|nr:glycosyltransferase [Ignavibacterium sp.]